VSKNFWYTVDMNGQNYYGLALEWNYKLGYIDTKIPKYIPATLKQLNYKLEKFPQHSPHHYILIKYDKKES